jgi:hypothetical protein
MVFDTLGLVGVPTADLFEHLTATITEATPLYELCASVLELSSDLQGSNAAT